MSGNVTINAGVISGGIVTAKGGQATGAGGSIHGPDPQALAALLNAVRTEAVTLAPSDRAAILKTAQEVEAEAASSGPRSSRVRQLLRTMRAVTEGTIGSLIATYLGGP